jgi:sugar (pentulose or hexulose) kinase
MLPYFAPKIVPRVPRAGVVSQELPAGDAAAAVRAVIEAQALSSRLHAQWMGVRISSLNVTGGASANREILQVYADVHGCPARRFETTNAAALGAALRACYTHLQAAGSNLTWKEVVGPFTRPVAGSTIEPDPGTAAIYADALARYEKLESAHLA